jgi:hypothetical protein
MDIANRNILTDERNTVIGNAEVLRVALSPTGEWLATLEVWSNMSAGYHDMNLKFWRYDAERANYELNTTSLCPTTIVSPPYCSNRDCWAQSGLVS